MIQSKHRRLLFSVLAPLVFVFGWLAYAAMWLPAKIRTEIVTANYCEAASDCQLARGRCDLENIDIWIPVNKNETERIENLMSRAVGFKSVTCSYAEPRTECVNRKCRMTVDVAADSNPESSPVAFEGVYACLPPISEKGQHVFNCLPALIADNGASYALDFHSTALGVNSPSVVPSELKLGDRFAIAGTFTPIERLSSDHWREYGVLGVFSVTDSFKKL